MHPEIVSIGPFTLHSFGAMMALGFVASWFVLDRLEKRFHVMPGKLDVSSYIMWLVLAGVAGARLCHVAEYWRQERFAAAPLRIFAVWEGGLVFYGGLAGAMCAFFAIWAAHRRERTIRDLADFTLAALPFGHAFGRLGCFLNGCCFGRLATGRWEPFGVSFPPLSPASFEQASAGLIRNAAEPSLPVVPSQLFEAAWLFVLGALLVAAYVKTKRAGTRPGLVTGLYFCGYALFRFFIEYTRGDDRPEAASLSSAQIFSIVLFVLGLAFAARAFAGKRTAPEKEGAGT